MKYNVYQREDDGEHLVARIDDDLNVTGEKAEWVKELLAGAPTTNPVAVLMRGSRLYAVEADNDANSA